MKYHLTLIFLIAQLTSCSPQVRSALDSSSPAGAIYQLLPLLFPGLHPSSSKAMKTYFIPQTGSSAAIKGKEITLTVPYSTSLDALVAEFYQTGISATVNSTEQVSGTTANNYNVNLTDQITASDRSTLDYTIKTSKGTATSNDLLAFSLSTNPQINSYEGTITGSLVMVYVPYGTDLSSLLATFSHNGKEVQVGGTNQTSGKNTQNFVGSVIYSVYSDAGTNQDYTVSVLVGGTDSRDLQALWLNSTQGTIIGNNILVTVANGTDISSLVTSFVTTGVEVKVGGKSILSGESSFDFTNPHTFTVVAKDGNTRNYIVSVNSASNFSIGGSVSGLGSGKSFVLQNNGGDNKTITSNGYFNFSTLIAKNSSYNATIFTFPTNQYCTIANGTGTATTSVANIIAYCQDNPGTTPQSFSDLGNQTIRDNNTGLIWMKCLMSDVSGIPVGGSDCSTGSVGAYDYCTANTNDCNGNVSLTPLQPPPWLNGATSHIWNGCNDANTNPLGGLGGKTSWRVPSRAELFTIYDTTNVGESINSTFFPNTTGPYYWTNDSNGSGGTVTHGWVLDASGASLISFKSLAWSLRCVSGP